MTTYNDLIIYTLAFISLFFQLFLLTTFFEKNEENEENNHDKYKDPKIAPSVSVIVPCLNEARTIEKTILSLLSIDYPKERLSILVVDDGSKDNTYEIAKKYHNNGQVLVTKKENGGKFTALNYGILNSKADFIACLDADSEVEPDALKKMLPLFTDKNVAVVTPAIRVHNPKNILQIIQSIEYSLGIFVRRMLGKIDAIYVAPGPFSIFRREILIEVGLFKHAYNTEDMEIALRLKSRGYRIKNQWNAYVNTVAPNTWKKLYKQRVRWTYGFIKNTIDYKHMIFDSKYGEIGTLTLPFYSVALFSAIFIAVNAVSNLGSVISEKIIKISTLGIDSLWSLPDFNLFFINTKFSNIIFYLMFSLTVTIIFIGRKMTYHKKEKRNALSLEIIYFLLIYGLISPIWIGKAMYNVIISKQAEWR